MSISIELREIGPITILDLAGESSIMDGSSLQQTVRRLTRDGKLLFILNLRGMRHLDSFGLGQLVSTYIGVRELHGDVKIVHPVPSVRELLHYTRIDTVLQVFPTEEEAVQELMKFAIT